MSQPPQSSHSYPNPNPNFTQAAPLDPYSSSSATYGGVYRAQPPLDPYFASATNGGSQAQPQNQLPHPNYTTFPTPALDSLIGTGVGSGVCPSYGNFNLDSQYLNTGVIDTAKLSNVVPTFQCEVCDVVCNGKDVLDKHTQGKKHQRKLQIQARSIHNVTAGNSSENVPAELEMKKQTLLQNGAPAGSLFSCNVCNIVCGDEAVFQTHLIGKKHAKQFAKQTSGAEPASTHCDLCQISCNSPELFKMHLIGKRHLKSLEKSEKTLSADAATENPEDIKSKTDIEVKGENMQETENKGEVTVTLEEDVKNKDPQNTPSTYCEVCKITCTSPQLLNIHLEGKKHKKNIGKAEAASFIGPLVGPVSQIIGPTVKPDGVEGGSVADKQTPQNGAKRSRGSNEDLETKKQKVMRGGGAPDLVRVCEICNVVCSSPTVYISHLAGRKHLAVAKKAAGAGIPPVTA